MIYCPSLETPREATPLVALQPTVEINKPNKKNSFNNVVIYFLNNPFGNPERKNAVEKHREFRPHF